jgi:ABC-2 type transport system permease protein
MKPILAVFYREYKIRVSFLTWFFFDMGLPLLYMLLFGLAFDKALPGGVQAEGISLGYNEFFLAGVLAMSCFGSATNQAYGFFTDRDNGILYEHLTYPMTRSQFLLGKVLFQCCMSLVQCLITLLAGTLLLHISLRPGLFLFAFVGVMLGTSGWFFFLSLFAFRIRRNDTFNTFINVLYFVLMFASSTFYPLDRVPGFLRIIAVVNPLTWHADLLRFLTIGIGSAPTILLELVCFIVFSVISFWYAVRTLQKTAI